MDNELNTAPWQEPHGSRPEQDTPDPLQDETTEYDTVEDRPPYGEGPDPLEGYPESQQDQPEVTRRSGNRTRKKKKKRKKNKNYLLRLFILLCFLAAVFAVLHIDYFTLDKVTVTGNDYLTREQVLDGTGIKTGKNIWDVHELIEKHKIKQNLYVEDVKIRRKLPNRIVVTVTEKQGLAQYAWGEKFVVTDNSGTVIEIAKEQQRVTLIDGVEVKSAVKNETIQLKDKTNFDKTMKFLAKMDEGDMFFKKMSMADGRVTAYVFDGLKAQGSYANMMDALEKGTLKTVVYSLYQKGTTKGTINVSGDNYCSFTP